MTISIYFPWGGGASQAAGSFSRDYSATGLTADRGLLACVTGNDNASGNLILSSVSVGGVSMTPLGAATINQVSGIAVRWFAKAVNTNGGSQTVNVSGDNGTNAWDLSIQMFEVTGHDVNNFVPTISVLNEANPAHIAITTQYANSAILSFVKGGFADESSATGYTYNGPLYGASNRTRALYKLDAGAAGANDEAVSQGWWANTIEIKAAGGSSTVLLPQMMIPPFFGFTPGNIR